MGWHERLTSLAALYALHEKSRDLLCAHDMKECSGRSVLETRG